MTQPRFAATRDANEPDIVEVLHVAGAGVRRLYDTRESGTPDLLVGHTGRIVCLHCGRGFTHPVNSLLECKMPRGNLSAEQVWFAQCWPGAAPVTVRGAHDALVAIGRASAIVGKDCKG